MRLLSDDWLSALNILLQWLAVAGTGLGLLSGLGLIFTRRELSEPQAVRLSEARQEASTARKLADDLQDEIEAVKRYGYVATLTFNGMTYTEGDVIMPTEISPVVAGTWLELAENRFRPVCEATALEKCRAAIEQFPDFPFSYYALAYCLAKEGNPAWHTYAQKAVAIFEKTTAISGHQKSHEQALDYLRQLLESK
jgi:tetratricopeptide (TPR) repeat protein